MRRSTLSLPQRGHPQFGVRNLTGEQAQPEIGLFATVARLRLKGDHMQGPDIQLAGDAPASLRRCHGEHDKGARLNQQPAVRIVVGPLFVIALVAPELGNFADLLERKFLLPLFASN